MAELVIRTEHLSRDYGTKRAVNRLNLEVGPGRVVALLGPNGAGKSTLLKLLTGLLEPTEGRSWLLGAPSRDLPGKIFGRVATMLDGHEPPRWATPKRMIALQAEASPGFDTAVAEELIAAHGLSLKSRYGTLSKGQKRWVLAVLCLASGADLLLLDEPAAGLDTAARREIYDRIRDYVNNRDATAIVTTHIIHDIERIADDVAILREGRLILHEPLEDLRERVREVDVPNLDAIPQEEGVTMLGFRREHDGAVAWLHCPEGAEKLASLLGSQVPIRSVGLEQLYLAVTGSDTTAVSKVPEASEAVEAGP
jgi:ABC-type multidrug transport system ATPase subunit